MARATGSRPVASGPAPLLVGRWEVQPITEDGRYVVRDENGNRIASTGTDPRLAHFIAAAPELLATLKALVERFPPSHGLCALSDAKDAIARAEGKEVA